MLEPEFPATLLVVDDVPQNLHLMAELLKPHYRVMVANSGPRALDLVFNRTPPDLILLDVMMPDMNGYDVIRQLKENPTSDDIPVIFVTALNEPSDEALGLELGAADYIAKPINPSLLLMRVRTQLSLLASRRLLRNRALELEEQVKLRTHELQTVQDVTVLALSSMAETRDNETGNHIRRTQNYVRALAEQLVDHPDYSAILTPDYIRRLFVSAPLHDIGKVGIPDHILLKPARLTPEEFEIMKRHAAIGAESIERAEKALGVEFEFLQLAKEIAHYHHEKWDGTGYPEGLAGKAIPLSARLMALADVYDALISKRVYKEAFSHEKALGIIAEGRGTHFDPLLLDTLLKIEGQFREIAATYADD